MNGASRYVPGLARHKQFTSWLGKLSIEYWTAYVVLQSQIYRIASSLAQRTYDIFLKNISYLIQHGQQLEQYQSLHMFNVVLKPAEIDVRNISQNLSPPQIPPNIIPSPSMNSSIPSTSHYKTDLLNSLQLKI